MPKWRVWQHEDINDDFIVEADTADEAAWAVLEEFDINVSKVKEDEDDEA